MITIVLADDEKLIRAGLKKILTENIDFPLDIIEAKNGEEALQFFKDKRPDLLITDIRMPVMDGVELMKNLSSLNEKPTIIVLSGYDDFSYAKAAIQSGAISYILKPVDKKELISAVNSAIMESLKAEKEKNEEKLRKVFETGRVDTKDDLPELIVKNGFHCVAIYGPNLNHVTEELLDSKRYYVLERNRNGICILYPLKQAKFVYDKEILNNYIVGVSSAADDYSMLRTLRRQSLIAGMQAFFDPETGEVYTENKRNGLYYYENDVHISDYKDIDEKYEKMISTCDIASPEELQERIDQLFGVFEEKEISAKLKAEKLYYLYWKTRHDLFTHFQGSADNDMYLHLKSIMIENISDFSTIFDWKNSIRDYVLYLSALLKNNTKESPYITEALAYIKTHFTKNINMAMVANQVSVNYTWFSEKFKEHTGINFNEYLKRIRMEEAKKLLQTGLYKVYEVANRSGFSDVKYFMKQFREETGMSPTEWSNKHKTV